MSFENLHGRWRAIAVARGGQQTTAGIVRWGVAGSTKRTKRILGRLGREALVITGLVLAVISVATTLWIAYGQNRLARDLETASEIQENLRFVRQVVIDNAAEKPFRALTLRGASLSGLDLLCEDLKAKPPTGCADLTGTDLTGAYLIGTHLDGADLDNTNLTGVYLVKAYLTGANLTDAHLGGAALIEAHLTDAYLVDTNLTGVYLIGADLTGMHLDNTDLTGADLTDTDLSAAKLTRVCYDDTTIWPAGFTPPPSAPTSCLY